MRNTIKITDLAALAAFENGKFVDTHEVKIVKHTPKREMIRAALTLGIVVPGVTASTLPDAVGAVAEPAAPEEIVTPEFLKKK